MPRIQIPNNWQPRDYQMGFWSYLESGGKRAIEIAHRRWGKDEVCLHWAAVCAVTRPATYWHMLPEASQARKAIWEAVNPHTGKRRIDEAFPLEIRATTREQEMLIRFVNGATWQVVGSDNFNALVGSPPLGVIFSEFALANPAAWAYLRPILLENGGWAAFITTPRGKNHAYKMLQIAQESDEWWGEVSSVDDTGVFTAQQLATERQEMIELFGMDAGEAFFEQEYHCSFEAAVLGAYYGRELAVARRGGRVTTVPHDPDYPVYTAWDLGWSDDTSIWWYQVIAGEVRILESYSAHGQTLDHFIGQMIGRKVTMDIIDGRVKFTTGEDIPELEHRKAYRYGMVWLPHDGKAKTLAAQGKSVQEQLSAYFGWDKVRIVPSLSLQDGIQAVRVLLRKAWIDKQRCATGIAAIEEYRRKYDQDKRMFSDEPVHDWTSHLSDALRMLAIAWREDVPLPKKEAPKFPQQQTVNQILAAHRRTKYGD